MKTYEQICAALDEKIALLENENTPLMELVDAYKEATALLANAQKMLADASRSIEVIAQNGAAQSVQLSDSRELAGAGALGVAAIAAGGSNASAASFAAGASAGAADSAGRQRAGGGAGVANKAMSAAGGGAAVAAQSAAANGGARGGQGWGEPAARGFPGEYQGELPF